MEIIVALERDPLDEKFIVEKGSQFVFGLGVCISQMEAPDSRSYPEKSVHLARLKEVENAITYKMITCTVDEISKQLTGACRAFGVQ